MCCRKEFNNIQDPPIPGPPPGGGGPPPGGGGGGGAPGHPDGGGGGGGAPPNDGGAGTADGKLLDENSAAAALKLALASSGKLPVFIACSSFNRSALSASIFKFIPHKFVRITVL